MRLLIIAILSLFTIMATAQSRVLFFTKDSATMTSTYARPASPTFTGTVSMATLAATGKITATLTTEQMRLAYDASNYLTAVIGSTGSVTINLTGTTPTFTLAKAASITGNISASSNSTVTGRVAVTDTIASLNTPKRVWMTADATNSTTSFADLTGLQFPVTAGRTYWFKIHVVYSSAATTTGICVGVNGPTLTKLNYVFCGSNGTTSYPCQGYSAYNDGFATQNSGSVSNANNAVVEGFITCSASGNVQGRFFSEVASSAITVEADYSWVEYKEIWR